MRDSGRDLTEVRERLERAYGLDRPPAERFVSWLVALASGDLGWSVSRSRPVTRVLASALPATLLLMVGTIFFELLIGLPAGIFAATRRGKSADNWIMASDHAPFHRAGIPFLYFGVADHPDYHRPTDTADMIDAEGLVVVTEAAHEAVGYLAERTDPLTVTIQTAGHGGAPPSGQQAGERRASLGTMPDFAFEGEGVRVQQVMPGSAAEEAGIKAGDVIIALDGEAVANLRSYSALLKSRAPGDEIRLSVLRDGQTVEVPATLGER